MIRLDPATRRLPEQPGAAGDPERVISATRYRVSLREPSPPTPPTSQKTPMAKPAAPDRSWWRLAERLLGGCPVSLRVAVPLAVAGVLAAGVAVAGLGLLGVGLLAATVAAFGIGAHNR